MFKRVQKRQRKQEKEEELGLDSEMKEVLGLQDTDSEESDSSSDEGASESEGAEEEVDGSESAGEALEQGLDEEDEDGSEASSEADKFPPVTVTEAVRDPLYLVSMDPEVRACILCPGKYLKNPRMSEVHKSSKAHSRRFTRFVDLVSQAGPDGDVRDLIQILNDEARSAPKSNTSESTPSKRAEKRKAKMVALKTRREKHKEIAATKRKQAEKAKISADATGLSPKKPSPKPPKKKRKVSAGEESEDGEVAPTSGARPKNKSVDPELVSMLAKSAPQKKTRSKPDGPKRFAQPLPTSSVSKATSRTDKLPTKSEKPKAVESTKKPLPPTASAKLKKARNRKVVA